MTLSNHLKQLIEKITTTADVDDLRQILTQHCELQTTDIDLSLTECLVDAWKNNDIIHTRDYLIARTFLASYRDAGLEGVLAKPLTLPLSEHSAFTQLMNLGYKRIDLLQRVALARQVLVDVRKSNEPELWAALQREVADCLAYSEGPGRAELLEQALEAYRATLEVRSKPPYAGTPIWAKTLQAMADTLYRRVKGERAENLRQARDLYEKVLATYTKESNPQEWAKAQHDLGTIWLEIPDGIKIKNIEKGIGYYKAALTICTREVMPKLWAETTNDLAIAYSEHPGEDRKENIEKALKLCKTVLDIRSPDLDALDWARSNVALGNIYLRRLRGGRTENLEQAVDHYNQALKVLSPELYPSDWARTCYDLAMAYSERLIGDRVNNLDQAIGYFQQTLKVYTFDQYPIYWGYVQTGLGYAHHQLGLMHSVDNLEQAIICYESALTIRTPANDPVGRATVQSHLGNVYADRVLGNRVANQEKALACYKEALQVRTRQDASSRWAETMNNMGTVYMERQTGNSTQNRHHALECFRKVLKVHKPLTYPHYCRRAARNLAMLYFAQQNWDDALETYNIAINAGEQLYQVGLSAESKSIEMGENAAIYHHAAFVTARQQNIPDALLTLESGKTRLLAEALRLRVTRPANVPNQAWNNFEQAGIAVRTIQYDDINLLNRQQNSVEVYSIREQSAQTANNTFNAAIKQVRKHAPNFLKELDLPAILTLLPDEQSVLITFCLTQQGVIGFVVSSGYHKKIQVVDLPDFTQATLNRLLFEPDKQGRITGGWVGHYLSRNNDRWFSTMEQVLTDVGEKLLAPILKVLPPNTNKLIFLPSGGMFLLPLHAALLSNNNSSRLCDHYQVSYAPSVKVLANSQAKVKQAAGSSLYAVINPEEDPRLVFTPVEGAAIANLFEQHQVLKGSAGTKSAVANGVRGQTYLHFSCHGIYNWNNPSESGLNLADGCLTLNDLQNDQANMSTARLVTLSACETGLIDIVKGSADEYVGLPAGFLLAGVPCVVSSLWSVPDISTALLMERFYRNHLFGDPDEEPESRSPLSPTEALHRAQNWLRKVTVGQMRAYLIEAVEKGYMKTHQAIACRRDYDGLSDTTLPFENPYYWAAFVIYGA